MRSFSYGFWPPEGKKNVPIVMKYSLLACVTTLPFVAKLPGQLSFSRWCSELIKKWLDAIRHQGIYCINAECINHPNKHSYRGWHRTDILPTASELDGYRSDVDPGTCRYWNLANTSTRVDDSLMSSWRRQQRVDICPTWTRLVVFAGISILYAW